MNLLFNKQTSKQILIFIATLTFTLCNYGQTVNDLSILNKEKLKKADEYYNLLEFQSAVELYLEIVKKAAEDTSILCRIGNSYRMLNDHVNAEEWYRKSVVNNESSITLIYKLYFAQELATNGKYNEALYWFKDYYKSAVGDQRVLASIKSIENLSDFYYDTIFYITFPVQINTQYAEYCPAFYKNGIVFLTDRNNPKSGFLNWYISNPDTNGILVKSFKFDNHIKAQYNAGPLSFYNGFSKVIFSQNYSSEKLDKKQINEIPLQLFMGDVEDNNQWTNIQLLPFSNKDFSYTQPSVSEDGKSLYFSSNIPVGYGGTDLYKSESKNGIWGEPVNLGEKINTAGDEMFPFIFHDSILYFSSNGHGGLGGLDIVKVKLTNQDEIDNFGVPINSPEDDFGIILSDNGLNGYFASNRSGGSGSDDIYGFKVIRITFSIKIIDENTTLPISNAGIFTPDEKQIGVTDTSGSCILIIPVSQIFELKIKKDNYESKIYTIEPIKASKNKIEIISIKKNKEEPILLTDQNNQIIDNQANVIYKVQIFASRKPPTKRELRRKYLGDLKIHKFIEDDWYKYSIGEYSTYSEAKKNLIDCKVYDAFIIAYCDNQKVNIIIAKATTHETAILSPITRDDIK